MGWFTKKKESTKGKLLKAHRQAVMRETLEALKKFRKDLLNEKKLA